MDIGINATYLGKKNKTGIENYATEAILGLVEQRNHDHLHLFSQLPISIESRRDLSVHISPFVRGWHTFRLPLSLLRHPVDIFFEPGYSVPPFSKTPFIVVVHDLASKHYPDAYSSQEVSNFEKTFSNISQRAAGIVFASQSTLNDFNKFYPNCHAPKKVIYQSYDSKLFDRSRQGSESMALPEKYILSIGRLEARKNTINLVKAYQILRTGNPEHSHKLILAGNPGHGYQEIRAAIDAIPAYKEDVIELGYVEDEHKYQLYSGASVFAYPSLYEGFGIPILESFASNTPVLTSKNSSIPEVAADAALYCKATDPFDIAGGLLRLLTETSLSSALTEKGEKQLKKFSWQEYAKELSLFINEVYESRNRS